MSSRKKNNDRIKCGMIMPIASYGTYSEEFWTNVRTFLEEAIGGAGMSAIPAWENDANDVIHAKIIENIASFPVMVGVIIGFNPNVMIECGMRLWTNKPILLLHSPMEKIPFDVGSISCLAFPIDFNYFKLGELKNEIAERLKYLTGKQYRTFKSYYALPQEVEEPKNTQKIDFAQFVSEIRCDIQSLRGAVMKCAQQAESTIGFSFKNRPPDFPIPLSGDSYPYQMGPTSMPSLTICPNQSSRQSVYNDETRDKDDSEEKEQK